MFSDINESGFYRVLVLSKLSQLNEQHCIAQVSDVHCKDTAWILFDNISLISYKRNIILDGVNNEPAYLSHLEFLSVFSWICMLVDSYVYAKNRDC